MTMDNTEVYKIGSKFYAIKKVRYAYLDNIEVYKSLYNIVWDGTAYVGLNSVSVVGQIQSLRSLLS